MTTYKNEQTRVKILKNLQIAKRSPRTKTASSVSNKVRRPAMIGVKRHRIWRCKIHFWEIDFVLSQPGGLVDLYSIYNRLHFGGKLPPAQVMWSREVTRRGRYGSTNRESDAISIASDLRRYPKFAAAALLHEMVHIFLKYSGFRDFRRDHGWEFQEEMVRLAKEGAFQALW